MKLFAVKVIKTNFVSEKKTMPVMLRRLTPGIDFTNILRTAFVLVDHESVKNTVKSSVSFYAFGIYESKSCTYDVDEIDFRG